MALTIEDVREVALEAARAGPLADAVQDVRVELGVGEDDGEFFRVALLLRFPAGDVDSQLESLLEEIENTVGRRDDRYASVRFLDAA